VRLLDAGQPEAAIAELERAGLLKKKGDALVKNRERAELEVKLEDLSIEIPWLETP
jgi:hypothetical protein